MKKILNDEFITSLWSGGETTQIYIDPSHATVGEKNFTYRISSATCDMEESIYTPYPDYLRYLIPLTNEMTLDIEGEIVRLKPFEILSFDGKQEVKSTGDVRDFNLIYRRDQKAHIYCSIDEDLEYRAPTKSLIFKYDGNSTVNGEYFEEFSAILLEEGEGIVLKGNGRHIICEIG
ncbi:MAG: HutD family protein [Tissierellia bacterium]|nr:HutD family protein [Tissierellia bacterium]